MYLYESNMKFVIRIPKNSYKKLIDPSLSDQIVKFNKKGKSIYLRVLKFKLDSGIEEILVTNLMDEAMDVEAFKSLYFKRWGIETKYDELKNKLQIQKFTGDTPISIKQDFYASIFLSNMTALVKQEADELIAKEQEPKELKHEYTVNMNIL
ncbi:transposase, partial [Paenisporosarcina sp. TG20]|uniref:transposase n=1 Tax=Paenisporosarcina sp. TG20 TaxID=1211706 RepID=UPI001ED8D05A